MFGIDANGKIRQRIGSGDFYLHFSPAETRSTHLLQNRALPPLVASQSRWKIPAAGGTDHRHPRLLRARRRAWL
jgi:hypothetical protein